MLVAQIVKSLRTTAMCFAVSIAAVAQLEAQGPQAVPPAEAATRLAGSYQLTQVGYLPFSPAPSGGYDDEGVWFLTDSRLVIIFSSPTSGMWIERRQLERRKAIMVDGAESGHRVTGRDSRVDTSAFVYAGDRFTLQRGGNSVVWTRVALSEGDSLLRVARNGRDYWWTRSAGLR